MAGKNLLEELEERRCHERLQRSYKLLYGVLLDLSDTLPRCRGELLDIGGGGIRFLTEEKVPKGSQLVIHIDITGWKITDDSWVFTGDETSFGTLQVVGVVMWVDDTWGSGSFEVGVKFTGQIHQI